MANELTELTNSVNLFNSRTGQIKTFSSRFRSGLLATFLCGVILPASAQLFSPQESPWAGLREILKKDKAQDKKPNQVNSPSNTSNRLSSNPVKGSKDVNSPKNVQNVQGVAEEEENEVETDDQSENVGVTVSADGRRGIWSLLLETSETFGTVGTVGAVGAVGTIAWLNERDIVPQNGAVMMSLLFEHDPAMLLSNGTSFRSAKARVRVDCYARPAVIVGLTLFSNRGGDGQVVGEQIRPFALKTAPSGPEIEAKLTEIANQKCRIEIPMNLKN